ncbi:hypothetical protein CYMTET_22083 [Cymbomonas tetramitiformis]|uniref:Sulfotransferase n=1 Tax=Cymbomonas tetramitiformis TaxID=36881 RepID=A0AAE0L2A3_9CHLO|nr:hypothetical protein CYMTET_22083 [Cymbomonas tetramitiformis]
MNQIRKIGAYLLVSAFTACAEQTFHSPRVRFEASRCTPPSWLASTIRRFTPHCLVGNTEKAIPFAYVLSPKVASSTLRSFFKDRGREVECDLEDPSLQKHFRFAFVRDPFERFLSAFHEIRFRYDHNGPVQAHDKRFPTLSINSSALPAYTSIQAKNVALLLQLVEYVTSNKVQEPHLRLQAGESK